MAKRNPGGGPGTHTSHGVRCTLDAPFGSPSDKGTQRTMRAPFNHGRSGGANGMPEEIYSGMGGPSATPAANTRDQLSTIKTNPKSPRR